MINYAYVMVTGHGMEIVHGGYDTPKAAKEAGEAAQSRQEYLGIDEFSPVFSGEVRRIDVPETQMKDTKDPIITDEIDQYYSDK